jgi:hypothetical protein
MLVLAANSKVVEIEDGASSGCSRLSRVSIPATVRRIGHEAFLKCASLSRREFADESSLVKIGVMEYGFNGAFREWGNLVEVVFRPSAEGIRCPAFFDCGAMERVSFPGVSQLNAI